MSDNNLILYRLTPLGGTYNGLNYSSCPSAINNAGQIAGSISLSSGCVHACLWNDGRITELALLQGKACTQFDSHSSAIAVNENGIIVGCCWTAQREHAVMWQYGGVVELEGLSKEFSKAYDVNIHGQIVGYCDSNGGSRRAVQWANGKISELAILTYDKSSSAQAINNTGQIVGYGLKEEGFMRALLWENGSVHDLGIIPGTLESRAYDINEQGQVIGVAIAERGFSHAFLWENGVMFDIGAVGLDHGESGAVSEASAINNRGEVVGSAVRKWGDKRHAFLYRDGAVFDLNDLVDQSAVGWSLERANDIGDNGQIVGIGINPQGHGEGFLLTPIA